MPRKIASSETQYDDLTRQFGEEWKEDGISWILYNDHQRIHAPAHGDVTMQYIIFWNEATDNLLPWCWLQSEEHIFDDFGGFGYGWESYYSDWIETTVPDWVTERW